MDQLSKRKLWIVLMTVMVLANIATIGAFWYGRFSDQQAEEHQQHPHNENAALFISRELKFSPGQEEQFTALREEHQQKSRELQQQLRAAKDELFASLADTTASPDEQAGNIGKLEQEMDLLTFHHFQQVRKICTAKQKQKFDEIIKEALRMMAPRPGGGRQGPPPRGNGQPPPGEGFPPPGPDGMPPPPPSGN